MKNPGVPDHYADWNPHLLLIFAHATGAEDFVVQCGGFRSAS